MQATKLKIGYISEQAYLESEKAAKQRHEYVDGQIFLMAGASRRHNDIAVNITTTLRLAARSTPCRVNASDVKVRIGKRKSYYYPDVVVSCTADDDADEYYLEKPCLIVEILSKSTEWKDYNEKLLAYQAIASLKAYLTVSQDRPYASLFYRDEENQWWVDTYTELTQSIKLPCPPTELTLAEIYEGIVF